jgi:hypothetical protein
MFKQNESIEKKNFKLLKEKTKILIIIEDVQNKY